MPFCVYILTNKNRTTFCVGVTNDLARRMAEHRSGAIPGFSQKYCLKHLVHFEETENPESAIAREKEIKGWRREKKLALIRKTNPFMTDLFDPENP